MGHMYLDASGQLGRRRRVGGGGEVGVTGG